MLPAQKQITGFILGKPTNLGQPINTSYHEVFPCISFDGLELYFIDYPPPYRRPGGYGITDIWVTGRSATNEAWKEPVNLGPHVSTSDDEGDASISADGLTLYFHSDRRGAIGLSDLLVTVRATKRGRWGPPVNLGPTVNSPGVDSQPCILANDLVLLFGSDRPGGVGGHDIYITSRSAIDQPWSRPVNLGPIVNSPADDWHPCISPNGSTLIFASDRGGGLGGYDLWQVQTLPNVDLDGNGALGIEDPEVLVEY